MEKGGDTSWQNRRKGNRARVRRREEKRRRKGRKKRTVRKKRGERGGNTYVQGIQGRNEKKRI